MPLLKIFSTIDVADREAFLQKTSRTIAGILHKPEKYVMIIFIPHSYMIFSGNTEPSIYMELKSIGLASGNIREITSAIMDYMAEETGVDPSRMFIEFTSVRPEMWGWNRETME